MVIRNKTRERPPSKSATLDPDQLPHADNKAESPLDTERPSEDDWEEGLAALSVRWKGQVKEVEGMGTVVLERSTVTRCRQNMSLLTFCSPDEEADSNLSSANTSTASFSTTAISIDGFSTSKKYPPEAVVRAQAYIRRLLAQRRAQPLLKIMTFV